ncbi:MAG: hypothetical protein ACM3SP_00745 [Chloroflexota bacterium]
MTIFARLKGAWPVYIVAAFIIICLLLYQNSITARFRPSNWLLRMTDDGLFVKFRSYMNFHFPDQDPTVAFIAYSEIRSAKYVKERQELPSQDGRARGTPSVRTRRFVDLELAGNSVALASALANETRRVVARSNQGGAAVSTRYQHFPVGLSDRHFKIEWDVVPSADVLLDALTRHTLVEAPGESTKDFTHLETLDRNEQEARLLELAKSGDIIGAVALARKLYTYDLTTAKAFVESLIQK